MWRLKWNQGFNTSKKRGEKSINTYLLYRTLLGTTSAWDVPRFQWWEFFERLGSFFHPIMSDLGEGNTLGHGSAPGLQISMQFPVHYPSFYSPSQFPYGFPNFPGVPRECPMSPLFWFYILIALKYHIKCFHHPVISFLAGHLERQIKNLSKEINHLHCILLQKAPPLCCPKVIELLQQESFLTLGNADWFFLSYVST